MNKVVLPKPVSLPPMPAEPSKPTVPQVLDKSTVIYTATSMGPGKEVGLLDALENLPKDLPLEDVKINISREYQGWEYRGVVKIYAKNVVPNPDYAPAMVKYDAALAEYKKKRAEWDALSAKNSPLANELFSTVKRYQELRAKTDRTRSEGAQMGKCKMRIKKLCTILNTVVEPENLYCEE